MVQASEAFESAILKNRTFYYKVRIVLTSGEELILTNRQLLSFKVSDAISNMISVACTPQIEPDISIQTVENKTILVIDIVPGDSWGF